MPITLQQVINDMRALIRIGVFKSRSVYDWVVKIFLAAIALILVEWVLNIAGLRGLNYVFLFLGAIAILIIGFRPIQGIGVGAALGGTNALLTGSDFTKGLLQGVEWWARLVLGVLFGWLVCTGFLATFSFEHSPLSFFPLVGAVLTITVTTIVFGWKRTFLPYIVVGYCIVIAIMSLYKATPELQRFLGSSGENSTGAERSLTPPVARCTVRALPAPSERVSLIGDHCFTLEKHRSLTVYPANASYLEIVTQAIKTEVELLDPYGKLIKKITLEPGKTPCLQHGWSGLKLQVTELSPGETHAEMRIRIGQPNRMTVPDC